MPPPGISAAVPTCVHHHFATGCHKGIDLWRVDHRIFPALLLHVVDVALAIPRGSHLRVQVWVYWWVGDRRFDSMGLKVQLQLRVVQWITCIGYSCMSYHTDDMTHTNRQWANSSTTRFMLIMPPTVGHAGCHSCSHSWWAWLLL